MLTWSFLTGDLMLESDWTTISGTPPKEEPRNFEGHVIVLHFSCLKMISMFPNDYIVYILESLHCSDTRSCHVALSVCRALNDLSFNVFLTREGSRVLYFTGREEIWAVRHHNDMFLEVLSSH